MKKRNIIAAIGIVVSLLVIAAATVSTLRLAQAAGPTCTPTGFIRDNINLTAALINPSQTVSGKVNATGCNIGIYFKAGLYGHVSHADISGANYYGVVNNGSNVVLDSNKIHDIGESPLNGTQHGVGIYFAFGSASKGKIDDNTIWNYQKGGIVVNGAASPVEIAQNMVLGQGPVNYIAQNGIQVGYGAQANIYGNTVTGNAYSGSNDAASGGIILVGGDCYGGPAVTNTLVAYNLVFGNDIGVWFTNLDANCNPIATPTKDTADNNTIIDTGVTNITGNFPGPGGYQAGIVDQGDFDKITNNYICGLGYTPVTPPPVLLFIDTTVTNNVTKTGNSACGTPTTAPTQPHSVAKVQAIH